MMHLWLYILNSMNHRDKAVATIPALRGCGEQLKTSSETSTRDESAIPSWHRRTTAQYGSLLHVLASDTVRTRPPSVADALASGFVERARMGATASSILGFTLAIRTVEDLPCIPTAATPLHKRIAAGAASSGPQLYLPPASLVILVENASKSRYGPPLGALGTLAWVCWHRASGLYLVL